MARPPGIGPTSFTARFQGLAPHACIVRQCGRSPMSLATSAGNNFSRIATTTRFCPGRPWAPREQLPRRARWMQRRKSGPDCLSAASFRAVRSASYGPLTLLRVAPTACPDKARFNEPVQLFSQNPWFVISTCDSPGGSQFRVQSPKFGIDIGLIRVHPISIPIPFRTG